jgi:hypothetical protein
MGSVIKSDRGAFVKQFIFLCPGESTTFLFPPAEQIQKFMDLQKARELRMDEFFFRGANKTL